MVALFGNERFPEDCPPAIGAQVLFESRRVLPVNSKEILPAKLWRKMTFSAELEGMLMRKIKIKENKCMPN